jgi:plasmid maintenance system antidote protein VapI
MKLSQIELARCMGASRQRANTLINANPDVTAETAIFLSRVFKTMPEF